MNFFDKIFNSFLTFFGDIKVFKFPMFIIYDPGSYLVKGENIREVIKTIQPGDIVIRGYTNYLDGYFIPGTFSHAGLYLGEVTEKDRSKVRVGEDARFRTGEQMVIHAMAEGVFMEDVINFCRCDYMLILRRNAAIESDESRKISLDDVRNAALQNLGKEYDFKFDFSDFSKLSCTELVYVCYEKLMADYDIRVRKERALLVVKKRMITPDAFVRSKLDLVWKSNSVTDEMVAKIKAKKIIG